MIGRIEEARARTLAWLGTMEMGRGVCRISAAHDPAVWPGMLLPGTYNAVMCRHLLGEDPVDARSLAGWLRSHRMPDGVFRFPGMADADVFKRHEPGETWRYIDFHVTNYALGAMEVAWPAEVPVLTFARKYLDPMVLKAWLADRDLNDPWLEGNNIVNLASFFLLMEADAALEILLRWHDYHRNPATGFWGVGQSSDPTRKLHAMAGSMHNFHIWYAMGRRLPLQERAMDYALSRPVSIDSACIDVDLVDLLVHGVMGTGYRREEVRAWLLGKLGALLDFQAADGGFADELSGVRRQDGWVRGYSEPQGISNTFATWFRWIAVAMIADELWPGRWDWRFRKMIGIGYRMDRR